MSRFVFIVYIVMAMSDVITSFSEVVRCLNMPLPAVLVVPHDPIYTGCN